MNLVFEPEEAASMHEGVIEMIADNPDCDAITSYGTVKLLDLSGNAEDRTEVKSAQDLIYDSAGVSKELFNATTQAGVEYSSRNDLAMMMVLGSRFGHFFTALLNNKFGTRKMNFKLVILPVSHYNQDDYITKAKDMAAFGYPFLTPVTGTGLNQTNLADLKVLENDVLDLDVVLKPLQSAYTQSGKTNAITAAVSKNKDKVEEVKNKQEPESKDPNTDGGEENNANG